MVESPQNGERDSDQDSSQTNEYEIKSESAHNVGDSTTGGQTMRKPKQKTALQAIEEALEILRSTPTLDASAKDSVEVLLETAVERLHQK